MRILFILLFVLLTINSNTVRALTISEAVSEALQHNPRVARIVALTDAAESRTAKAAAPFWPSLELNYSYRQTERDPLFGSNDQSIASASASYNLFNGGSDWFRHDAAQSHMDAVQWQRRSLVADIVLAVRQAYIEVLRSEQNLATSISSLNLLQQQHKETELRLAQGLIARNDLLRVAVEMATSQQVQVATESELNIARHNLAQTLGRQLEENEILADVALSDTSLQPPDELHQQMMTSRSELHFLRSQTAAQTAERKAIRGDMLPDVDLTLSHDRVGNHALPNPGDTDYDSGSTIMLEASWTLFSGFDTHHELAGRKHEILALNEEIRETENRLNVQLSTAIEKHRVARTNLDTARTSVLQAEENYRVNANRYKAQVATTVDLLDAEEFLTRARNEEIKAQYDLYNAIAVIERVLERGPHLPD